MKTIRVTAKHIKMNTGELFNMALHEEAMIETSMGNSISIIRVKGGWIYTYFRLDSQAMTSTFVSELD